MTAVKSLSFAQRKSEQNKIVIAKAGYHHDGGALPFTFVPPICVFRVNRCVRPYTARTHVRKKMGKFWHIGVVFRLVVWYTRLNKSEVICGGGLL